MNTKTKKTTRLLALALICFLLINGSSTIIYAENLIQNIPDTSVGSNEELSIEELADCVLLKTDIPDVLSLDSARKNGHATRLREQEPDLNSIIFQNYDGSKTLYHFSYPVKYVDVDGVIRDKSNSITTVRNNTKYYEGYAFVNNNNDIKTYFPKSLSPDKGIVLQFKDVNIKMAPISGKTHSESTIQKSFSGESQEQKILDEEQTKDLKEIVAKAATAKKDSYLSESGKSKEAVTFNGVFGNGTSIRYTPTYEGVKEDIVLTSYMGINEFSFSVETNGLTLLKDDLGEYVFVDPLNGDIKAKLGEVLIFDSTSSLASTDEQKKEKYDHYYVIAEAVPNSKYTVTIVIDEAFLTHKETIYPVYIDPQITIWHSAAYNHYNGSDNYIQDTVVYGDSSDIDFTQDNENYGSSGLLYVGAQAAYGATARSLIDFEWLKFTDRRNPLAGTEIKSAKLYIRDLFSGHPANVIHAYGVTEEWLEYTATGALIWNSWNGNTLYDSRYVYYGNAWTEIGGTSRGVGFYDFNITAYVNGILEKLENMKEYTGPNGIILKAEYEDKEAHIFASKEYSISDYKPALVVNYSAMTTTQKELNINSGETVEIDVTTPFSGEHDTFTSDPNIATVALVNQDVTKGIRITGHSEGVATIKINNRADPSKFVRCTVIVSNQNLMKIYISPANHTKTYTLSDQTLFNPSIHNEKVNMEKIGDHLKAYLENYYVNICLDKVDRSNGNQSYEGRPAHAKAYFFQNTNIDKCLYLALHANAGTAEYTVAFHNAVGGQNTIDLSNELTDALYPIIPNGKDHSPINGKYTVYNDNGEMLVYEPFKGNLGELRENENTYSFVKVKKIVRVNNRYKYYPETDSTGNVVYRTGSGNNIPAIILETAFFDNPVQADFLINKSNERLIAKTIAETLIKHYNLQPRL